MESWQVILISALVIIFARLFLLGKVSSGGARGGGANANRPTPKPKCAAPGNICSQVTRCCYGQCQDGVCKSSSTPPPKRGCFSIDTIVRREDGSRVKMVDVKVGDLLRTGDGLMDRVALVSQRNVEDVMDFIRISTEDSEICVTPDHFVYVIRKGLQLIKAREISMNDSLICNWSASPVVGVEYVRKRGFVNIYMANTPQLLVNGDIIASPLCDDGVFPVTKVPVEVAGCLNESIVSLRRLLCV